MDAAQEKIWELIETNTLCMMVTEGDPAAGEPKLAARPMQAVPEKGDNQIWFYTRLESGKTEDLRRDGTVCLTFADPHKGDYVSITGHAELTQNRAKIKEHWNTFIDAWFPEGPDGEDVGLIRVVPDAGQYWDSQSSRVVAAMKMALASQQNQLPNMGENAKVSFG